MNLRGIDLNLLALLEALLEEGHVSRAARRVGLSQPAMSNALDRCRQLLGDPLLERHGAGMRLTPRAHALRGPLVAALGELGALLEARPPGLAEIERTVRIVMADRLAALLLRPLLAALVVQAPGVTIAVPGWVGGAAALEAVRKGAADLAVSAFPPLPSGDLLVEPLVEDHYSLAGRIGHPALAGPTADGWLAYPHVVVSSDGTTRTGVDEHLAAAGLARRVGLAVPSFLLVPDLLRGSDLLALLPGTVLAGAAGDGLATCPPPVPVPGFRLDMARHRRSRADLAVDFVAQVARVALAASERPDDRIVTSERG